MDGRIVPDLDKQAMSWFRQAAEQGNDEDQFRLATVYYNGEGATQDYAKAFIWFEKASDQNNFHAQYSLGLMYANGKGVAKDESKAQEWIDQAGPLLDSSDPSPHPLVTLTAKSPSPPITEAF